MDHRFEIIEQRLTALDHKLDQRIGALEEKFDHKLDQRFGWLVGIQLTTLVAITAALLAR